MGNAWAGDIGLLSIGVRCIGPAAGGGEMTSGVWENNASWPGQPRDGEVTVPNVVKASLVQG